MSITFLNHDDDSIDFVDLLTKGDCHYVSVAMPGLTSASAYVEFAGGFNVGQRNDFMMTVNHAKKTGTLCPRVNITLLPSLSASYGGMDTDICNDRDYSEGEVIAHILDAFKANSQNIKSGKMYFDFRDLCVSEARYVSCLKAAVQHIACEELPEIITWEPKYHRD